MKKRLENKMATRKKKESTTEVWPRVNKGSHLTVITHEDGKISLEWDDAALTRDVKEALESYKLSNMKPSVKAKVVTRKKKEKVNE